MDSDPMIVLQHHPTTHGQKIYCLMDLNIEPLIVEVMEMEMPTFTWLSLKTHLLPVQVYRQLLDNN